MNLAKLSEELQGVMGRLKFKSNFGAILKA